MFSSRRNRIAPYAGLFVKFQILVLKQVRHHKTSMTHRTVVLSDFESYLAYKYRSMSLEAGEAEVQDRQRRLVAFPHAVILQVAYPELDFANRWCWQQFGPAHGECLESYSEYPACNLPHPHNHEGKWFTNWLEKTDYDFGYNEWCFSRREEKNRFLEFVPQINWGERYPK
jgi:hypothetical protein